MILNVEAEKESLSPTLGGHIARPIFGGMLVIEPYINIDQKLNLSCGLNSGVSIFNMYCFLISGIKVDSYSNFSNFSKHIYYVGCGVCLNLFLMKIKCMATRDQNGEISGMIILGVNIFSVDFGFFGGALKKIN